MTDLLALLENLQRHNIDFVLVGGFAAVTHGASTLTQDVDVCCDFSIDNLLRLSRALADIHPVHRMTPQKLPLELTPESCKSLKNLYLDTDMGQLDCLSSVMGVGSYDQVRQSSCQISLPGGPCRVLDLDALIESKKAMNRPRDLEAVLQLETIRDRRKKD
ncbi:MAG: nucleotidyltransferase [Phycisphaeraceae bacterium]|nr:nucleotidyltransferase [Phycisphaeraceae bacterium]